LLTFRKSHAALHNGKLKHYFPTDGTYLYFRFNENENYMIIMNNNNKDVTIELDRYAESIKNATIAIDIINNKEIPLGKTITLTKKSVLILDLK
jgi:hypothetical protein